MPSRSGPNIMKPILLISLLLIVGCSQPVENETQITKIETKNETVDLFDLTALCDGTIKYQAERRGKDIRERVTCEWSNNWELAP